MKTGLPLSQWFDDVYPVLKDVVDVLVLRDAGDRRAIELGRDAIFHTNGFLDDGFDHVMSESSWAALRGVVGHASFDLGPGCRRVTMEDGYRSDGPVLTIEEAIRRGVEKTRSIRKVFPGTLAAENLDYHPTGAYEVVCNADFIKRFLLETGLDLCLDLAHLQVTCHNLEMDSKEYLAELPLESVTEVHFSHAEEGIDAHDVPVDEDYGLLLKVLARAKPEYIVIEHYGSPEGIIDAYSELARFLSSEGYR